MKKLNKQQLKLQKALKIINKRLPSSYRKPKIKIYQTVYPMLRSVAKEYHTSYKEGKRWIKAYWKKQKKIKTDYIETKYFKRKSVYHPNQIFDITAFATDPIKINLQNTRYYTLSNYIFLILHEIGHWYNKRRKQYLNEKLADEFAIRWIKKFKQERLIK